MNKTDQIEDANYTVEESTDISLPLSITQALVNVDEETSLSLKTTFMPFSELASQAVKQAKAIIVTDASQIEEMAKARELRLILKKIRNKVEEERKSEKAEILLRGKAIDGIANVFKYFICRAEKHLQDQEDFVKRQEMQRKLEISASRILKLQEFGVDTEYYNLAEMSDEGYESLLETAKFQHERKLADLKREDEERVARAAAEEKRQKEIEADNKRLRDEAEKAKLKAEKEQQERDKIEAENIKKHIAEQQALEAKLDKERQAQDAKLAKERKAKEVAMRMLTREREEMMAEVELSAEKERLKEERIREARLAPDKKKLEILAGLIAAFEMPDVSSKEAQATLRKTVELLNKVSNFIKSESGKL